MNSIRILLLAGAACAGVTSAQAAILTQVSSLAATVGANSVSYAAINGAAGTVYAAGTPTTFASPGLNMTFVSNTNVLELNNQSSYIDNNFALGAQFINQCGYSGLVTCNASGAVTISFSAPTLGFTVSADDFDGSQAYAFTAKVYNGTTLLGSVTTSSLANNGASPAVLAAVSSVGITSVVITDPTGNFVLADVGAVPEPASLAVLATGLLGVAGLRRHRRG